MHGSGYVIAERYRIECPLGEGGMGVVYEATDLEDGRRVALKVLGAASRDSSAAALRLLGEARAASRLRHPGVVEVLEFGEHEGAPWLVMELLVGETLRARLQREGRLSVEDTLGILRQVLDALAAVHDAGIVHRDLKPDNIFLVRGEAGPRVKVLDFGIAKELDSTQSITATGMVLGTAHYLAPEQAKGARRLDGRTDLYAVGVIAFECLTDATPYEAESLPELVAKMFSEPPRALDALAPHVPRELVRIIGACLSLSAEERPASARELAARLERAASSAALAPTTPVLAPTAPLRVAPTEALPRGSAPSRARLWLGLSAAAFGAACVVVGTLAFGGLDDREGARARASEPTDSAPGERRLVVPMLADVDGDGIEELIGPAIESHGPDEASYSVVALDALTGDMRWSSDELRRVPHGQARIGLAGTMLLFAQGSEVVALRRADGTIAWRIPGSPGEAGDAPVSALCAPDADSVVIAYAARPATRIRVRLEDGSALPLLDVPCARLVQNVSEGDATVQMTGGWERRLQPWARRGPPPAGLEVREHGFMMQHPASAFAVFSLRADPSGVGVVRENHVLWRAPLWRAGDADQSCFAAVAADSLYLAYTSEGRARLEARALEDGVSEWDTVLPPRGRVLTLLAGAHFVVVGFADEHGRPWYFVHDHHGPQRAMLEADSL